MLSPLRGLMMPIRSLPLLFHPQVRGVAALPVLLNLMVYGLLLWLAMAQFDIFIQTYLPEDAWWSFFRPVLWVIFVLAYAIAMFFTFTIFANLIAAPFNAVLAARIETVLTGQVPECAPKSIWKNIAASLAGEVSKLAYLLKWAIPLLLLFLIPGVNVFAALAWTLFGFWFLTIEYIDYPLGNHGLSPKQQRQFISQRRFTAFAFGAGVSVVMLFLGFIAMPLAVAAATVLSIEQRGA